MKKFMSMLAFLGLCMVAFALLLARLLSLVGVQASALVVIQKVGEILAYIVTMVYAFNFVKGKRSPWWWVAYWVSVVVVVLLVVLQFTNPMQ